MNTHCAINGIHSRKLVEINKVAPGNISEKVVRPASDEMLIIYHQSVLVALESGF